MISYNVTFGDSADTGPIYVDDFESIAEVATHIEECMVDNMDWGAWHIVVSAVDDPADD